MRKSVMEQMAVDPLRAELSSTARRKVEELTAGVKEQASKLKTKSLDDLWKGTVEVIKENPGKTILVSVAMGFVIGTLLRRRGD
jgi:ElaB/YqjD/DUF883 family membrane-anchored ribosome-binding protein